MDCQLLLYITLALIGMSAALIIDANKKIRKLRILLEEERKKRAFPLLVLRVDREAIKAYLKNESYCYAKDIVIDDLDLVVEYGFKKKLQLRFDRINILKPNQEIKLSFRVFDNEFDVTSQSPDSLVLQFHDNPFAMHLTFANLEDEKFRSTIAWDSGEYVVKDVRPLDEKPAP